MLATNLTKLRNLALNGVDMSDIALTSFLNLPSSLEHISLSYSQLHGEFPTQVSQLPNLKVLDLSEHENLTGYLPITQTGVVTLSCWTFPNVVLGRYLSYIKTLSGGVPSWLFTLRSLPLLDLSYNKLVGPIDRIQKPSSIQDVKLSYNNIGGSIPCSIFDLVNLTSLDLSSNNLSGVIKSDMLSKLTSLEVLDVSSNSLLSLSTSGNDVNDSFPRLSAVRFSGCSVRQFLNFFQSSQLEVLDLSNNMISGGISRWEAE
ncbi:hypothetical protein Gohar_006163, partial [Gossypium harknessii]|nr:hypothetical protein [Gossypium harknessii]